MKPVQVSIDVPQPPETVYDFLDVLANHELFTDHMFRDWTTGGPASGVGAKARFTAVAAGWRPGRTRWPRCPAAGPGSPS
jgi:hypothetical protein